jgi:hypothetical protein
MVKGNFLFLYFLIFLAVILLSFFCHENPGTGSVSGSGSVGTVTYGAKMLNLDQQHC